ncbi:SDR family oxidoreductase [Nocardiopsis sp. MG754419]|uniref:SDR family NAD(P)-dependent oxidoreductase n=1 Tax=Nocardiopsis sp. MG754419 TaxID=2259865 RepID=UPI001BA573F0|nr:SDR family NAD(P)-dependent oxidoreductase [Nocardiopsis sp. MG754419]MBR8743521.1 short-chain dehydrogenase [Nocardiopsis sp. MG754419]
MSAVIAVFGAGTGLGASLARRFGRSGFRVALVARRRERLDTLVDDLARDGIEAAGFTADLSRTDRVPELITEIRDRFGRIDVIEYGPFSTDQSFVPASRVDAATLESGLAMFLLTPVEVVQAVLPEWAERGDGAFLLTSGVTAVHPMPGLSGLAPLGAAARNYLYSLHGELAEQGIYVGTISVGATIARSEMSDLVARTGTGEGATPEFPVVDPDDLAELYWDMYTARDRVEQLHPHPDGL